MAAGEHQVKARLKAINDHLAKALCTVGETKSNDRMILLYKTAGTCPQ